MELIVELLIPDTTAFTAFNTLKRMGFDIIDLKRADYYKFDVKDEEGFFERIKKVDILVNANKHKASDKIETRDFIGVIVQDMDKPAGLLSTLKERLGFSEINSVEKGTLWKIFMKKKDVELAKKITEALLYNKNYQSYRVV